MHYGLVRGSLLGYIGTRGQILGFGWSQLIQGIKGATVETVIFFNSLVTKAQKAARSKIRFVSIPLGELQVIGWCDASFANVTDGRRKDQDVPLASQAGYMIGFACKKDVDAGGGRISLAMWKHTRSSARCAALWRQRRVQRTSA